MKHESEYLKKLVEDWKARGNEVKKLQPGATPLEHPPWPSRRTMKLQTENATDIAIKRHE